MYPALEPAASTLATTRRERVQQFLDPGQQQDGFVSLGVIASAAVVALGFEIADPIVGLIITLVILRITWQSWQTIRSAQIEIDHFEHRRP